MEFHVDMAGAALDPDAVCETIRTLDPAAVADVDASGRTLRIAAALDRAGLVALLAGAGHPVSMRQVRQLPSICCGGCSG